MQSGKIKGGTVEATPALLEAQNLKIDQSQEPISLTVASGERVGLFGSAGSGKGALLQTLARLKRPAGGKLLWNGVDVSDRPRWLLGKLRRHILMLWGNPYALFSDESKVSDIISLPRGARTAVQDASHQNLSTIASVAMGSLSATARVQVAVGYAQLQPAQVILIDDLFTALSPKSWAPLLDEVTDAVGQSRGLIIASQYRLPMSYVDKIYVMLDGTVVERGRRERVLTAPLHPYTRWLLNRESLGPVHTRDWERQNAHCKQSQLADQ